MQHCRSGTCGEHKGHENCGEERANFLRGHSFFVHQVAEFWRSENDGNYLTTTGMSYIVLDHRIVFVAFLLLMSVYNC